jgi:hypothetical protein
VEDCGVAATYCRRRFESTKKVVERRERHRLTYAHERPSMISRIIDMSGAKWTDKEASKQLMERIPKTLLLLVQPSEAAGRTPPVKYWAGRRGAAGTLMTQRWPPPISFHRY